MRVYLDVCCLNRPFDDQSQERVRLESEAVKAVIELATKRVHRWVSSDAVGFEVAQDPDDGRRRRLQALLRHVSEHKSLDAASLRRARALEAARIPGIDAVHLAIAERAGCDAFLTVDDVLLRRVRRLAPPPRIRVCNPLEWIAEDLAT
jgi:predicted nucleic acid-binding protein